MKTPEKIEWLGVIGSRWAWATVVGAAAFFGSLTYAPGTKTLPTPNPVRPSVELQDYTTDTTTPLVIGGFIPSKLPAPDSRQRKPPCAVRVGEEAIDGYCWLKLTVQPPCPIEEHAHEYKNSCYVAVLRAASPPTSREGQIPVGVSGPTTP